MVICQSCVGAWRELRNAMLPYLVIMVAACGVAGTIVASMLRGRVLEGAFLGGFVALLLWMALVSAQPRERSR